MRDASHRRHDRRRRPAAGSHWRRLIMMQGLSAGSLRRRLTLMQVHLDAGSRRCRFSSMQGSYRRRFPRFPSGAGSHRRRLTISAGWFPFIGAGSFTSAGSHQQAAAGAGRSAFSKVLCPLGRDPFRGPAAFAPSGPASFAPSSPAPSLPSSPCEADKAP